MYGGHTYRKVSLLEDSSGCIHMKNLSMQQATNEEEGKLTFFTYSLPYYTSS